MSYALQEPLFKNASTTSTITIWFPGWWPCQYMRMGCWALSVTGLSPPVRICLLDDTAQLGHSASPQVEWCCGFGPSGGPGTDAHALCACTCLCQTFCLLHASTSMALKEACLPPNDSDYTLKGLDDWQYMSLQVSMGLSASCGKIASIRPPEHAWKTRMRCSSCAIRSSQVFKASVHIPCISGM